MENLILKYLRSFPLDYGKEKLSKWLNPPVEDKIIVYTNKHGIKFNLNLNRHLDRVIYQFDIYERNTIRHLLKLCKPSMTFIDVGANVGFYSLTMAKYLTDGEVHAFEPNPSTYEILKENLLLNSYDNIKINPVGLGNKNEANEFYYNENLVMASSYKKPNLTLVEKVNFIRFDEYCEEAGIENVDILKVDIEGGELNFLLGSEEIINKSKNLILVVEVIEEHCIRAGYSAKQLYEYICEMGFIGFFPKPWPFSLKRVESLPDDYFDNIIFLKGYKM